MPVEHRESLFTGAEGMLRSRLRPIVAQERMFVDGSTESVR
jgi:hypothetical protein